MPHRHTLKNLFTAALLLVLSATAFAESRLESPNGEVVLKFLLQTNGLPAYSVDFLGKPVVLESRLGVEPDFTNACKVAGVVTGQHEGQWTNDFGERRIVPDNYREMDVDLKYKSGQLLRVVFRAYNEGAAFRYSFPAAGTAELHLSGERTEFRFPKGTFGFEEHGTEGEYHRTPIGDIQPECERPLTLEYANGFFAGLCEADNENYPRLLLSPLPGTPDALVSALGGTTSNTANRRDAMRNDPTAMLHGGDSTPWRVFIVGRKPGDLLERNYLLLNLNPPCALPDTSWIKPGKAMRDVTLTTTNSKAIIDFAATGGLQYVELDSQWYGRDESFETGDATKVRASKLDLPEIIRYGNEKNVCVILYVDGRVLKKQRDILFPLYEKWGVKGVKIGFVNVGPQSETAWITDTIEAAAKHHLVLDIHDGYRATGNNRTWPNLLTVEGIRGNEHMPTPEHNCTLPFTRYLAGIADYTICYYDHRIQTTHAHQLAMAVVSFSPIQCLFWYDRPSNYHNEPEIEFFRRLPTVWDETIVVSGEIGRYATIARRSGADWFVGMINNGESRTLDLPLTFLEKGKEYQAHIYYDEPSAPTRAKVGIRTREVNSQTVLNTILRPAGGEVVWITPKVP